jgi:hypothetical protein
MDLVESKNRNSDNAARHPWELARFRVVNKILSGIIRNEKDFNVLDIGCGDVFFVSSLARLYPEASYYAIDTAFTDDMISSYTEQVRGLNVKLFKSLTEAVTVMKGKADLVLLLDVVEHIGDDEGFLKALAAEPAITPQTNVLITVPAFQALFCSHDEFLGHYRRYTNAGLKQVVERAGFRGLRMGYFFTSLLFPRLLQVMKEKVRRRREDAGTTGLVEWKGGGRVTSFMTGVLYTDYKICRVLKKVTGISLPGLSNYILCKKAAS